MAEFNRTALDMMDELYAPYKAAAAQGRQMQRSSAGLELQRRTQVADTEAKWAHEKAGTMAKWINEEDVAKTAQESRQANITLAAEEGQRVADEAAEDTRARVLQENRNDVMAAYDQRREKEGGLKQGFVETGITKELIEAANDKSLARYKATFDEQDDIVSILRKDRNTIVNQIAAMMRTPDGADLVQNVLDGETLADLRSDEWTKEELAELLAEINMLDKVAENKPMLNTIRKLRQERDRLFAKKDELTGESLQKVMMDNQESGNAAAASDLSKDPLLMSRLTSSEEGDLSREDALRVQNALTAGGTSGVQQAMTLLKDDEAALQVMYDAYTKWIDKNKAGVSAGIMGRIQGHSMNMQKIDRINTTLRQYYTDYKWLNAIPVSHFYDDKHLSEITETPVDNETTVGGEAPAEVVEQDDVEATLGLEGEPATVPSVPAEGVALEGGLDSRHSVAMEVLGTTGERLPPDEAVSSAINAVQKEMDSIKQFLGEIGATRDPSGKVTISKTETKPLQKIEFPISGFNRGWSFSPARRREAEAIDAYNKSLKEGVDEGGNLFTRDKAFDLFARQSQVAKTKYERLDELLKQYSDLE